MPSERCQHSRRAVRTRREHHATMRGHARVTFPLQIPLMCGAFVVAVTRSCPRFRPWFQDGKEGVDGSSPSEGLKENPANGHVVLPAKGTRDRLRHSPEHARATSGRSLHHPSERALCGAHRLVPPWSETAGINDDWGRACPRPRSTARRAASKTFSAGER